MADIKDLDPVFGGGSGKKEDDLNIKDLHPIFGLKPVNTPEKEAEQKDSNVPLGMAAGLVAGAINRSKVDKPVHPDTPAAQARVEAAKAGLEATKTERLGERQLHAGDIDRAFNELRAAQADLAEKAQTLGTAQQRATSIGAVYNPPAPPLTPSAPASAPPPAPAAGGALPTGSTVASPSAAGSGTFNYGKKFNLTDIEAGQATDMTKQEGGANDLIRKRSEGINRIRQTFPGQNWQENPAFGGLLTPGETGGGGPRASFTQTEEGNLRPTPINRQSVPVSYTPEQLQAQKALGVAEQEHRSAVQRAADQQNQFSRLSSPTNKPRPLATAEARVPVARKEVAEQQAALKKLQELGPGVADRYGYLVSKFPGFNALAGMMSGAELVHTMEMVEQDKYGEAAMAALASAGGALMQVPNRKAKIVGLGVSSIPLAYQGGKYAYEQLKDLKLDPALLGAMTGRSK